MKNNVISKSTILDIKQTREVGVEFHDTWIDVNQNSDWMTVAMIHDKKKKVVTCYVDGKVSKISYSGEIIDYRDSWIWIGVITH